MEEEKKEVETTEKVEEKISYGKAIATMVLGIVSTAIGGFIASISWIGLACGIVGLVLAIQARKECPCKRATAGFVLSIIGTSLCGIMVVACVACAGTISLL